MNASSNNGGPHVNPTPQSHDKIAADQSFVGRFFCALLVYAFKGKGLLPQISCFLILQGCAALLAVLLVLPVVFITSCASSSPTKGGRARFATDGKTNTVNIEQPENPA